VKKALTILFFSSLSFHLAAQEIEQSRPFNTDRPGQSINPNTVGDQILQFQSGYGYLDATFQNQEDRLHSYDVMAKYGIAKRFEVASSVQIGSLREKRTGSSEIVQHSDVDPEQNFNGVSQVGIFARGNLLEGDGLKPAIGLELGYVWLGRPGESLDNSRVRTALTFSSQLLESLSFTGNVVYLYDNEIQFTANLGYAVSDRFGIFVEYWPIFLSPSLSFESDLDFYDSYLNTGLFYQVGEDFQLDATAGFQLEADETFGPKDAFYLQVGFTKRFQL
jgi:hypothetical protein